METTDADGNDKRYLSFDIGDERYAVGVAAVEVVLEIAVVTRVPKSPPHWRGVINHRGSVVPVVDLRVVFGQAPTDLARSASIIVAQVSFEGERLTAGILADAVQEVIDLDVGQIEAAPGFGTRLDGTFIKGIGKRDDRFIILLDLEKALAAAAKKVEAATA
jgi:purine-binding chemotaxis protein CheW